MSVDITQLSAHLAPALQDEVKQSYKKQAKSDTTAFLLTFFLGMVGAHRFYLGQWLAGIAHLALTIAGVIVLVEGIINSGSTQFTLIIIGAALLLIGLLWEAIDLFVIDRQVNARNLALAERLITSAELTDDTPEKAALAELDRLTRATAAPAAGAAAGAGIITAAEVADARAMAEETAPAGAASAQFSSMSRMELSDNPQEDRREAEVRASEATVTGEPAAEAPLSNLTETEGVTQSAPAETTVDETNVLEEAAPAAALGAAAGAAGMAFVEVEHHTHEESGYRTTDSIEKEEYAEPEAPATEPMAAMPATEETPTEPETPVTPVVSETPEVGTETTPTEPISSAEVGEPSQTMIEPAVEEPAASGPSAEEMAGAAGVGALAGAGMGAAMEDAGPSASSLKMVSPDLTDAHPVGIESAPVADVATPGASAVRIAMPPAEQSAPEPDLAAALTSPELTALPPVTPAPQEYVPPTVPMSDPTDATMAPVAAAPAEADPSATAEPAAGGPSGMDIAGAAVLATLAGAGAAMAGDALLHQAAPAAEAAPPPPPPPAPTADETPTTPAPAMKRIRAVRHIVVDGKVVSEVSAEEIVPVDEDSAEVEARLQEKLGHLSAEQIAEMTHLSPEEIELHQQQSGS